MHASPSLAFSDRPAAIRRCQTVDKVGFCHCEPVTDVTGVAIRIPRKPHQIGHSTGERIPTPVLRHWLGMTGVEVCLHIDTAIRRCFYLPEKRIISRKGCKNQLTITADNDKILT